MAHAVGWTVSKNGEAVVLRYQHVPSDDSEYWLLKPKDHFNYQMVYVLKDDHFYRNFEVYYHQMAYEFTGRIKERTDRVAPHRTPAVFGVFRAHQQPGLMLRDGGHMYQG